MRKKEIEMELKKLKKALEDMTYDTLTAMEFLVNEPITNRNRYAMAMLENQAKGQQDILTRLNNLTRIS